MVKQLIIVTTLLLIQYTPEAIHYTCAILDFTMLAQYLSHNNKSFLYMNHASYRLDKTKIIFENLCSIDAKLFQSTFNYLKFHIITYFVK